MVMDRNVIWIMKIQLYFSDPMQSTLCLEQCHSCPVGKTLKHQSITRTSIHYIPHIGPKSIKLTWCACLCFGLRLILFENRHHLKWPPPSFSTWSQARSWSPEGERRPWVKVDRGKGAHQSGSNRGPTRRTAPCKYFCLNIFFIYYSEICLLQTSV